MIRIVADAGVAIKWLLPEKHDERDWENALRCASPRTR
jgi:predicted nucleic acid-binding protein